MLKAIKREGARLLEEKIKDSARRKAPEKWILAKDYESKAEEPQIVAVVREEWQKKLLLELGVEEVEVKNPDIARECNLDKIDKDNRLAGNLYQLLENKKDKVILDWNQNISNSYAMHVLNRVERLETVCISPELKKEDLVKIAKFDLKKEMVIYGRLRAMYIEADLGEDTVENEQRDNLLIKRNQFGNTEVYYSDPMNLIPRLTEIKKLGFDRLRLEFTFESEEEIRKIVESLKNNKGMYMPYNYEEGVY
jgi:putative protease